MVTEEDDAGAVVHFGVLADKMLKENGRHGRDIFVAEAQVGAGKTGVAGFHVSYAGLILLVEHVAGEDLLSNSHGPLAGNNGRQKDLLLHAGHVEREKPAVVDNLAGNVVFAFGELAERDFFTGANLVDEAEVRRSQDAEILTVLLVDALNIFGDHHLDSGTQFGVRRLLAAGTFASPLAAHGSYEAASFHVSTLDRDFTAALQPCVRKFAQGLIKEEADVRGSDFVSGDVVAQPGVVLRVPRVPGQVFPCKLTADQLRIFGEKKDTSLQLDFIGTFLDMAIEQ